VIEQHYKTKEVAALLAVHEETVLRLAQRGELGSVRIGNERRYPESAIRRFLERHADQGPPPELRLHTPQPPRKGSR
jgi:excisionase family DNA binding protein